MGKRQAPRSPEEISPDSEGELPDPAAPEKARAIVLRALDFAPKTRKQLADLLRGKEIPADVAATVLDRFEEVGLIDDALYAQMWVRSRHQNRGLARRVLRQELIQRGISTEQIEAALVEVDDASEAAAARQMAQRKLRSMSRLDEPTAKRRLFGMLMRRGYAPAVAGAAIDEAMSELATPVEGFE